MKILHVIHSLDPRSGGPSHALRGLVREQIRMGHDVSLIATTTQSAEPWKQKAEYVQNILSDRAFENTELVIADAYGRKAPWSRYAFSPQASRWLRQRFASKSDRPEFIHIHGTFSHLTSRSASLARRFNIPYAIRPAGSLNTACFRLGRQILKELSLKLTLKNDLRRAAFIHAMSAPEADELATLVDEKSIHVIPHGIDFPDSEARDDDQRADQSELIQRFPQLAGKRIILFMSRIHAKKRPELLLQAVQKLNSSFPDLMILIAGTDAGHLPFLQKYITRNRLQESVIFTGFLQGTLKSAAFSSASIFALPSVDENFGVAVVEAMAHKTPVLVTPGVASHVYVDESGAGMTVGDDPDSIAAGIRTLLAGDRSEMGRCGRDYVQKHLSWTAIVKKLDELYEDAVDRNQHNLSN